MWNCFFFLFLQNVDKKVETKKEAMKLSGIGKSIGEKVEEFAQTGKLAMMEDLFGAGQEGKINISESTYYAVREYFECEKRGKIEIKNKSPVNAFWLNRLKPEYSEDGHGFMANNKLFAILGFGAS